MPRLFTGLEIPAELAMDLAMLRGGFHGARWIDRENYHITLRFIGDVDHAAADDVAGALDHIRRDAFTVTLDELSVFGGDRPRAVVVKAQPAPALIQLQAEQERLLRRVGVPPETRKFTPHVTLARLRDASIHAVADYLGGRMCPPRPFQARRFVLFSSRDSVGGGPYVIEETYPFRMPAAVSAAPGRL